MTRVLHPRHGLHEPTASTPPRRAGSVRRTATTDILRPDGPNGALHLVGRVRDLSTGTDETVRVLASDRMHAVVDYAGGQTLTALDAGDAAAAATLVGASAGTGFRARMRTAYAQEAMACSPLNLLLDDIPVCTLISGHALSVDLQGAGDEQENATRGYPVAQLLTSRANQCAGFEDAATIMAEVRGSGRAPVVVGPVAPALDLDDVDGWHDVDPLPPRAMRRRRRLDVHREGDSLLIDAMFRDTYALDDATETVIHEYTIDAVVDAVTLQIREASSVPRVLPWLECPSAAASAQRLAGSSLLDLRSQVRAEFYGISTCTHLNDALRGLEDVSALARVLDDQRTTPAERSSATRSTE